MLKSNEIIDNIGGILRRSVEVELSSNNSKPGQKAQISGQYGIMGPRGANTHQERTVTKGEPFPPTPKPGQSYVLNDRTKHGPKGR
jgi:hypothetical protein